MSDPLQTLLESRALGLGAVVLIIIAGALHGAGQRRAGEEGESERSARLQKIAVVLFIIGAILLVFAGPFKFWQRP